VTDVGPDLNELFPNIRGLLDNWDNFNNPDGPLQRNGETPQVTDDDISRYFQSRQGPYRAPINPAVSGQQVPPTPEFYRGGRQAPSSSAAVVEEPDLGGGDVPGDAPPPPTPIPGMPEPSQPEPLTPTPEPVTPPVPPGGPEPLPPEPGTGPLTPTEPAAPPTSEPLAPEEAFIDVNGRRIPKSRLEAWGQFDALLEQDPNLQAVITQYLQGQAPQPTQPTPPVAQVAPAPEFQLSEDDLADPTVRALYNMHQQTAAQLADLRRQTEFATQTTLGAQQRQHVELVNGAVTAFAKQYDIPDDMMQLVRNAAARTASVETYMKGMDPITGVPVAPDPYKAVERALEIGYWMVPELRERAYTQREERIKERAQADSERKRKLAGVSGASGSVPRTQPAPTTEQGRRTALLSEVGEMMNGSWTERS
jgi:hypothetical protein